MEEKKSLKISLTTLLVFVSILILFALIFYICIGKVNNKKQMNNSKIGISNFENVRDDFNTENDNLISNTVDKNMENLVESDNSLLEFTKEININSEEIIKIYNYIPCMESISYDRAVNAYQDKKVTKENLNEEYLLGNAFTKLSLSNSDVELIEGTSIENGWYTFDADLLQQKVKEMYGENIENRDFEFGSYPQKCDYENGRYTYSYGGSYEHAVNSIREIERAYENEENLYIEDKFIALEEDDIEETCKLYANSQMNELLKQLNYSDFLQISPKNIANEIKNNSSDLMKKFKHTFKKNSAGDYYWYSTEPIR